MVKKHHHWLCDKTLTANPQYRQSPRFMAFSKSFFNTKAKSTATSQANRIFLSIFRGGHAVIFNCFIIGLYRSGFALHFPQKSLHYSNYTSPADNLIKLVLPVSIPLLLPSVSHSFHAAEHLVKMTLFSFLHLLEKETKFHSFCPQKHYK